MRPLCDSRATCLGDHETVVYGCVLDYRHSSIYGTSPAPFTAAVTADRWTAEQSSFISEWRVGFCSRFTDTWRNIRVCQCQFHAVVKLHHRPRQHIATSSAAWLPAYLWSVSLMIYAFHECLALLCIVCIVQLMLWSSGSVLCMHFWLQLTDAKVS